MALEHASWHGFKPQDSVPAEVLSDLRSAVAALNEYACMGEEHGLDTALAFIQQAKDRI